MCGIAGRHQQEDGERLATLISERLAHRGPDGSGPSRFDDGRVTLQLGHRRLSIIDLPPAGAQPFSNGLTLSYNGELYNYRQLRAELPQPGVTFRSSCDRADDAGTAHRRAEVSNRAARDRDRTPTWPACCR